MAPQPVLLGRLTGEGRISLSQIGQAATLEAPDMTIAKRLAGAFFEIGRRKLVADIPAVVTIGAIY